MTPVHTLETYICMIKFTIIFNMSVITESLSHPDLPAEICMHESCVSGL